MKNRPTGFDNLHFYPQIEGTWCWAAISSMLIACKGGTIKQCEIISKTSGRNQKPCQGKCGEERPTGGEAESPFLSSLYKNLFNFKNGLFRSTKGIIQKKDLEEQFEAKNYVAVGVNYDKSIGNNQNIMASANVYTAGVAPIKTTLMPFMVCSDSIHFCLAYDFEVINDLCFLKVFDPENWLTTTNDFHFTRVLFHEQASRYFGFLLDQKPNVSIKTKLDFPCKAMDFDDTFDYKDILINSDVLKIIKVYASGTFEAKLLEINSDVQILDDSNNNDGGTERGVKSIKTVSVESTKIVFYEMHNFKSNKNEFIPMFVTIVK